LRDPFEVIEIPLKSIFIFAGGAIAIWIRDQQTRSTPGDIRQFPTARPRP
jgi:hypothetical protein